MDCVPEAFKPFITAFGSCVCEEFDKNTGSGNVKRVKTEGRLKAIGRRFVQYFELAPAKGSIAVIIGKDKFKAAG